MRHSKQGTWLIRALVYALYTYACDKDIQSIFEEVIVYTIQVSAIHKIHQTLSRVNTCWIECRINIKLINAC